MTRDRDTYPVRWRGGQAIVTLPEQIDVSNAGQIREELLSVINRGAAVLIADMTATLSCDHAGTDVLVRVYQRALASGTRLRLVVTALIVQRVLGINGLDRLIPIYSSLEAAVAADTEPWKVQADPGIRVITPAMPETTGLPRAADQADRTEELLDRVVKSIFDVPRRTPLPCWSNKLTSSGSRSRSTIQLRSSGGGPLLIRQSKWHCTGAAAP